MNGADAENWAWGQKIAEQATQKGKDEVRENAKNEQTKQERWERNYRQFLVIAIGESKNADDASGIACVMLNRMAIKNTTFDDEDWLYKISTHHKGKTVDKDIHTSFNAYKTGDYDVLINMSDDSFYKSNSKWANRLLGAESGYEEYLDGFDASEGAYFWNATAQKNSTSDIGANFKALNNGVFSEVFNTGDDGTTFFKYSDPNKKQQWP